MVSRNDIVGNVKRFFNTIQYCILALIYLLIVFPLYVIICTPISIFRLFVAKVLIRCRPELGKILSSKSVNFCIDKPFEKCPAMVNIVIVRLDGNIPLKSIQSAFEDRIFQMKLSNGEVRYPELKQYPTDWFGFKFWRNDESFSIDNHIFQYNASEPEKVYGKSDIQKIHQEMLEKPFKKNKSLWDFWIVHNCLPEEEETADINISENKETSETTSLFIFRYHHSMAAGYSILTLILEGLVNQKIPKNAKPNIPKTNFCKKLFLFMTFPFRAAYDFAEYSLNLKKTHWHVPRYHRKHAVVAVTKSMPLKSIKEVKKNMGVSMTSVILSACAGAIQGTMLEKGQKLPQFMSATLPFPLPGGSPKLRNHMAQVSVNLPIAAASTAEERIRMLHKSYEKMRRSAMPLLTHFLAIAVGSMFTCMTEIVVKSIVPEVLISNFPAAFDPLDVEGHKSLDVYVIAGIIDMPSISFMTLSFSNRIRVCVTADGSILTPSEIQGLADLIGEEMQTYIIDNVV